MKAVIRKSRENRRGARSDMAKRNSEYIMVK